MPSGPDFEALEDAVVAQLAASPALLEAFAIGDEAQMRDNRGARLFPATGVMLGSADLQDSQRLGHPVDQEGRLRWVVVVAAMGYRDVREGARKGARGAYTGVRAAIDQLLGFEPLPGCPMQLDGISSFDFDDARLTGYSLSFSHEFQVIENGY